MKNVAYFESNAKNPFLEAVGVQGHLALLTEEDRLHVPLALVGTLLAIPPLRLPSNLLGVGDPVVEAIESGLNSNAGAAVPLSCRVLAVDCEHLNDQLPQEVQEGLLDSGCAHAQPPGLHGTHTEGPRVDGPPPLADAERNP